MFCEVSAFRNSEYRKEHRGEGDAAFRSHALGRQIDQRSREKREKNAEKPNWQLGVADAEIHRHLPPALAFVFLAQHQHGEGVERETPDHAKSICLAEG